MTKSKARIATKANAMPSPVWQLCMKPSTIVVGHKFPTTGPRQGRVGRYGISVDDKEIL